MLCMKNYLTSHFIYRSHLTCCYSVTAASPILIYSSKFPCPLPLSSTIQDQSIINMYYYITVLIEHNVC